MESDHTMIYVECENRNHDGLSMVMEGARLPNELLGQDSAFLAMILGDFETITNDLEQEVIDLKLRVAELTAAITKHRAAQGHNMCWENDVELYDVLGDNATVDHTPPPRCEFRKKCREYYERLPGAEKKEDGW